MIAPSRQWFAGLAIAWCVLAAGACGGGGDARLDEDRVAPSLPTRIVAAARPTAPATASAPTTAATEALPTAAPTSAQTGADAPTLPAPSTALPDTFLSLDPNGDRDCDEFADRDEAQAYWEYHRSDQRPNPGRLDGNDNGIVCEEGADSGSSAPLPAAAVPAAPAAPSRPCNTDLTCGDFGSWQEMNDWWQACGRPDKYDRNGDGVPCESLR